MKAPGGFLFFGLVSLASAAAHAQSTDEKAAAELLFNDARRMMNEGNDPAACAKLEESQRIDPALGTLGWLARCYEQIGRTASAWATYKQVASMAQQRREADRQKMADERAQALEPSLARITLDTAAVKDVPGVEIGRNGKPLSRALWGSAIPVDPGDQSLSVTAPGYESRTLTVTAQAGAPPSAVAIPALVKLPEPRGSTTAAATPPAAVARAPAAAPAPTAAPAAGGDDGAGSSASPLLGYVAMGLGAVGIGVGTAFFFDSRAKVDDRDAICPKDCTSTDARRRFLAKQDEAKASSTLSLVSAGLGVALVATGVTLVLTAPKPEGSALRLRASPIASHRDGGLLVEGAW